MGTLFELDKKKENGYGRGDGSHLDLVEGSSAVYSAYISKRKEEGGGGKGGGTTLVREIGGLLKGFPFVSIQGRWMPHRGGWGLLSTYVRAL